MEDIELLFEDVKSYAKNKVRHKIKKINIDSLETKNINGKTKQKRTLKKGLGVYFNYRELEFDSQMLTKIKKDIAPFVLNKHYRKQHLYLIFSFGEIKFMDKITYMIFDAILYYIIKTTKFDVSIEFSCSMQWYTHEACRTAVFMQCYDNEKSIIDRKKMLSIYKKPFNSFSKNHYRSFIDRKSLEKSATISKINNDVATFLQCFYKKEDEDYVDSVSEVVAELVDNVKRHSTGDSLVDIYVVDTLASEELDVTDLTGVFIAIINFSKTKLNDVVKRNIEEKLYSENDVVYKKLYDAYGNHNSFFDNTYTKEHFFDLAVFQKHIGSKIEYFSEGGGTGLTRLIERINGRSHRRGSYVLSGDKLIMFWDDFLKLGKDEMYGFNLSGDFVNCPPAKAVINKSYFQVPGTIYNLEFIKK